MRMAEVRALLIHTVTATREECAKIADRYVNDPHGSNPSCATAESIAFEIRQLKAPSINVIRPETAALKGVGPHTIVAGQALIDDEIVDRKRTEFASKPRSKCKYGDPLCPCQDGDSCHYEGPNAWPAPAHAGAD